MKKTIAFASICAIAPFLMFSAEAQEPLYMGGPYVGIGVGQMNHSMEGKAIVGYCNEYFLAEFGYCYTNFKYEPRFKVEYTANTVSGRLGLRNRIKQTNIFVCYGAAADYSFMSQEKDTTDLPLGEPYGVAGFVGLDYHANEHYLISAKSNVYSYTQTVFKDGEKRQVFGTQTISFAYVF